MSKVLKEKILSIDSISSSIYKMEIESTFITSNAKPGQFVNVKCADGIDALLRRPISINSINKKKNSFTIAFSVKGAGTKYLSVKKALDFIDIIGPLGNGFEVSSKLQNVAIIGGGIGIFPLYYLLENINTKKSLVFLGFRNKENAVLINEFRNISNELYITTDDGSLGEPGVITDKFEKSLESTHYDLVYACGPTPMLKNVLSICNKNNIKCQISLEQRMGCGIGACLVCAQKIQYKNENEWNFRHICKDGPVFWGDEVIIND